MSKSQCVAEFLRAVVRWDWSIAVASVECSTDSRRRRRWLHVVWSWPHATDDEFTDWLCHQCIELCTNGTFHQFATRLRLHAMRGWANTGKPTLCHGNSIKSVKLIFVRSKSTKGEKNSGTGGIQTHIFTGSKARSCNCKDLRLNRPSNWNKNWNLRWIIYSCNWLISFLYFAPWTFRGHEALKLSHG